MAQPRCRLLMSAMSPTLCCSRSTRGVHGVFNVTGQEVSFRDFLEACRSATHSNAEILWVPQAFLEKQGPQDWHRDYPYFAPQSDKPNFYRVSSRKARAAGWET